MTKHITAIYKTRGAAEEALGRLEAAGFSEEQISYVMTDTTRGDSFAIEEGNKSQEYAETGMEAGGALGAITAALMAAAIIPVPALGLGLIVIGPVAAAFAGLGAGGLAGGIIGGLTGMGVPEREAKLYEDAVNKGNILLAVHCDDDEQKDKAESILNHTDAYNVQIAA